MTMLKLTLALLSTFFLSLAYAAPSGCVAQEGKIGRKLDPNCNCLKTKTCYKGKPIKDDYSFFAPVQGKSWIGSEEKDLLKENHKNHNKLLELKSQGLVRSPEARELYKKMNEVNQKLQVIQKTNNDRYMKSIAERKKRLNIEERKPEKSYLTKLADFIKTPFEKLTMKSYPAKKSRTSGGTTVASSSLNSANLKKTSTTSSSSASSTSASASIAAISTSSSDGAKSVINPADLSEFERERVLANLEIDRKKSPQKLTPQEGDSLFTQISKAYLRVAYEVLLSSEEKK